MIGHCDTVWPIGTLQSMPLQSESDTLHGPGIYDMKAGLVEIIYALKAIDSLGLKPSVAPLCFVNSDEEIGSRESTHYVRALAQRVNRCMVLEPSLGHSGKIKTARKGVGRFTVTVEGKAAHAGLDPGAGASAILELSHVIQKLFLLNDPAHGTSVNVGVIVHLLSQMGLNVVGAKLTGAARYRDMLSFKDAGASAIYDFVDAGLPSSAVDEDLYREALPYLLSLIANDKPDVVVAEAGASPLEPYNGSIAKEMIRG
ncbi:MAG: M20 family metallopeptidase, partial [Gammaproteobacteria bacterium]|nr:M20 family metallopeptidase [Gammaproteobacteria bacterium]